MYYLWKKKRFCICNLVRNYNFVRKRLVLRFYSFFITKNREPSSLNSTCKLLARKVSPFYTGPMPRFIACPQIMHHLSSSKGTNRIRSLSGSSKVKHYSLTKISLCYFCYLHICTVYMHWCWKLLVLFLEWLNQMKNYGILFNKWLVLFKTTAWLHSRRRQTLRFKEINITLNQRKNRNWYTTPV